MGVGVETEKGRCELLSELGEPTCFYLWRCSSRRRE